MRKYFINFETTSGRTYEGNIVTTDTPDQIELEICSVYLVGINSPIVINDITNCEYAETKVFDGNLKY